MVRDIFKEEVDYYRALFNTKIGIVKLLVGNLIGGFIIVRYTPLIYSYILNLISFLSPGFIREYVAYLVFGLALIPLWLSISFVITRVYRIFFKNGRII